MSVLTLTPLDLHFRLRLGVKEGGCPCHLGGTTVTSGDFGPTVSVIPRGTRLYTVTGTTVNFRLVRNRLSKNNSVFRGGIGSRVNVYILQGQRCVKGTTVDPRLSSYSSLDLVSTTTTPEGDRWVGPWSPGPRLMSGYRKRQRIRLVEKRIGGTKGTGWSVFGRSQWVTGDTRHWCRLRPND